MQVTDVRTMKLTGPLYHAQGGVEGQASKMLVRVDTDAGIYGLGEAECFMGVVEGIQWIKDFLVGRSPLDVRPLVSEMLFGTLPPCINFGDRLEKKPTKDVVTYSGWSPTATETGPIVWAASGVEMALCDIVGKTLKTPAYNLFGGKFRDIARVYLDRSVPEDIANLEAWKEIAGKSINMGFNQIKFDIDYTAGDFAQDIWNRTLTSKEINAICERLAVAREAIGWDMELCVDAHRQYNAIDAIRLANALAPLKLFWFEDPVAGINYDACACVKDKSPIAICLGEMFIPDQFRVAIDNNACDIIHPDVMFVGGMHAMKQVSDYAELHSIPTAMHGNGGCLATIAAANVAAACRSFLSIEYHFIETDWIGNFVKRQGAPLFKEGHVPLIDAPGLGVEVNEEVCRKYLAPGETLF